MQSNKTSTTSLKVPSLWRLRKQFFLLLVTLLMLGGQPGLASETSLMTNAIAAMCDLASFSESAANSIGASFKAFVHTNYDSNNPRWYRIELPTTKTVVNI